MESSVHISIVSPVYRSERIVPELVRRISESVETITQSYEIILVNDASPDGSWQAIEQECIREKRVKGINLSRNFGQHYAISAGLSYARGEWVVVMVCDLQDRPDEIPNLYRKAQEGWDIVYAQRKQRQDGFWKKMSSKLFYMVFNYLSGTDNDGSIANFGIYHQKVITEFNKLTERSRSFAGLINLLGFRKCAIAVAHADRFEGASTYSFAKLVQLALSISISNSNKPLYLTIKVGFMVSLFTFLLAIYNVLAHFWGIITVPGYTSTIFSIWFVGGLIILILGIIGLYIDKMYDELKRRPLYIIADLRNFPDKKE